VFSHTNIIISGATIMWYLKHFGGYQKKTTNLIVDIIVFDKYCMLWCVIWNV